MKLESLKDIEVINYHLLINMYCHCEDYLEEKMMKYAMRYCDLKGINSNENSLLILSYPVGKNKEQDRKRFFDSPAMISENLEFEGVFAIYVPENTNEEEMNELIKYVNDYKSKIHFVLMMTQHNKHLLNEIQEKFSHVVNMKIIDELESSSEELYKRLNQEVDKEYFNYLLKNTKLNLDEIQFKMIYEKETVIKKKKKLMF